MVAETWRGKKQAWAETISEQELKPKYEMSITASSHTSVKPSSLCARYLYSNSCNCLPYHIS